VGKPALFLAVTLALLAVFGWLVWRTYRGRPPHEAERPKHRMLDED
jgi:hypothetical protein